MLKRQHARLKRVRGRGSLVQPQAAQLHFLRSLEHEHAAIREALDEAWRHVDMRDSRKCLKHMDAAQQRLHKAIKRLAKGAK